MTLKEILSRADKLEVACHEICEKLNPEERKNLFLKLFQVAKSVKPDSRRGFNGVLTDFGISRTALAMNLGAAGWRARDVEILFYDILGYRDFTWARAYAYKGKGKKCLLSQKDLDACLSRLNKHKKELLKKFKSKELVKS